jgi:hypothetical protein
MKYSGKCESEYCIVYLPQLLNLQNLCYRFEIFHLSKILFRNLAKIETFYKTCVGGSDMYRRRNDRGNLFWVDKDYEVGNLIVSNSDRSKLVIDIFRKCERAKK